MANNAVKVDVELNIINSDKIADAADKALRDKQLEKSKYGNDDRGNMERFYDMTREWSNKFRGIYTSDGSPEGNNIAAGINLARDASKSSDKVANDIMKIMKTGIGIIEDIHTKIKQASPLLQSVESLFNLATQLFFMPLGNKLATVMIPAIMQLVDDVMEMWDKIEGMDLGEMLNEMIKTGASIFGEYFKTLGEELAEQTGLAGSIGQILVGMGDFIENHLADLLKTVVDVLNWVMDNLGALITAFIEFKILSLSLQVTQIAATLAASSKIGALIAGAAFIGTEVAANSVVASTGVYDATRQMATGGYVNATPGGKEILVGEGGEGEFILPESKLQNMMNSVSDRMVDIAQAQPATKEEEKESSQVINNYFTINGYTDSQLRDIIRDTVNEQVSQSRLRSGF